MSDKVVEINRFMRVIQAWRRLAAFPVHPFLFALFPILFFFAHNQDEVAWRELQLPVGITLVAVGVLYLLWFALRREWRRGGLMLAWILMLFFSYGQALNIIGTVPVSVAGHTIGKNTILMVTWLGLLLAGIVIIWRVRSNLRTMTSTLNVASAVLIVTSLVLVLPQLTTGLTRKTNTQADNVASGGRSISDRPDIYYIVLEDYASDTVLSQYDHYDNSSYTNFLKQQGFYVASQSRTNYPESSFSLASSLNLDYLQTLHPGKPDELTEINTVFPLLQNPAAARFLKQHGYTYYHLGSWFQPTKTDSGADHNYVYSEGPAALSDFQRQLLNMTMAGPFVQHLFKSSNADQQLANLNYQFATLPQLAKQPGPKFVFAHIIMPHDPFVFDAGCRPISQEQVNKLPLVQNYLNHISCVDKKMEEIIPEIKSASAQPPIILVQSDEGSHAYQNPMPDEYHFYDASVPSINERTEIQNAYFLPGTDTSSLYQSISPVNSFRLVFNHYFNAELPMLPDKTYLFHDRNHMFDFINASEKLSESK